MVNLIESIVTMLNLNNKQEVIPASSENSLVPSANNEPVWKVLIFDDFGRDIISSVLKVNDLRENGVTVHMYVNYSENFLIMRLTRKLTYF